MCTYTDIIEAICSSIMIPFRYECLQNIQADVCLASESLGLYTETHIHRQQNTQYKNIQMLIITEIIYNHALYIIVELMQ